jgi:hypothetical protein
MTLRPLKNRTLMTQGKRNPFSVFSVRRCRVFSGAFDRVTEFKGPA